LQLKLVESQVLKSGCVALRYLKQRQKILRQESRKADGRAGRNVAQAIEGVKRSPAREVAAGLPRHRSALSELRWRDKPAATILSQLRWPGLC
jgi:hypothetical protein